MNKPETLTLPRDEWEKILVEIAPDEAGAGFPWAEGLLEARETGMSLPQAGGYIETRSGNLVHWPHDMGFSELSPAFKEMLRKHNIIKNDETGEITYSPAGSRKANEEANRISEWHEMSDLEKIHRKKRGETDPWEEYDLGGDDDVDYHGGYVIDMLDALDAAYERATGYPPHPASWLEKMSRPFGPQDRKWSWVEQWLRSDPEIYPSGGDVVQENSRNLIEAFGSPPPEAQRLQSRARRAVRDRNWDELVKLIEEFYPVALEWIGN